MQVQALERGHWPEVYRLMVARGFPNTPKRFAEAEPFFASARLFGLFDKSEVAAGFVFGPPEDGIAFFDVVCRPDMKGIWATPGVLKELFRLAFGEMGLRCVWVQPHGNVALRAALGAGFVPATPLDVAEPVLVMTPGLLPKRLRFEDVNKEE